MSKDQARAQALARSRGICQFCGSAPATDGHHWAGTLLAGPYPRDRDLTGDDLTALCRNCHHIATAVRCRIDPRDAPLDSVSVERAPMRVSDVLAGVEVRSLKAEESALKVEECALKVKRLSKEKVGSPGMRFMSLDEVQGRLRLIPLQIYSKINANSFPKPRKLGPTKIVWVESEVDEWIDSQKEGVDE